jgi:hypothetical protein
MGVDGVPLLKSLKKITIAKGLKSLAEFVSTQLNKEGPISLSKSCSFQRYIGVCILGTSLLVGCEFELEICRG